MRELPDRARARRLRRADRARRRRARPDRRPEPPPRPSRARRTHGAERRRTDEVDQPAVVRRDYGYSELPSEEGPNPARVTAAEDDAQVRARDPALHARLSRLHRTGTARRARSPTAHRELIELARAEPAARSRAGPRPAAAGRARPPRRHRRDRAGRGRALVDDGVTRYSVHRPADPRPAWTQWTCGRRRTRLMAAPALIAAAGRAALPTRRALARRPDRGGCRGACSSCC